MMRRFRMTAMVLCKVTVDKSTTSELKRFFVAHVRRFARGWHSSDIIVNNQFTTCGLSAQEEVIASLTTEKEKKKQQQVRNSRCGFPSFSNVLVTKTIRPSRR
jgi:hypothetical protein